MRVANYLSLLFGSAEGIQYQALRFAVQEGLRVVLAMKVHELTTDLREHGRGYGRTVDPGAAASVGGYLPLQNESAFFDFNSALVSQRSNVLEPFHSHEDPPPRPL